MPKFRSISNNIQQTTQNIIDDSKAATQEAFTNIKEGISKTIQNNSDKEYKKEVSKTKEKLVDIREDVKKSTSEELDKIQKKLAPKEEDTASIIEELEDTSNTLVSEVDFSQNEGL